MDVGTSYFPGSLSIIIIFFNETHVSDTSDFWFPQKLSVSLQNMFGLAIWVIFTATAVAISLVWRLSQKAAQEAVRGEWKMGREDDE